MEAVVALLPKNNDVDLFEPDLLLPPDLNPETAIGIRTSVKKLYNVFEFADSVEVASQRWQEDNAKDMLTSLIDTAHYDAALKSIKDVFSGQVSQIKCFDVDARRTAMKKRHTAFYKLMSNRKNDVMRQRRNTLGIAATTDDSFGELSSA